MQKLAKKSKILGFLCVQKLKSVCTKTSFCVYKNPFCVYKNPFLCVQKPRFLCVQKLKNRVFVCTKTTFLAKNVPCVKYMVIVFVSVFVCTKTFLCVQKLVFVCTKTSFFIKVCHVSFIFTRLFNF